MEKTELHHRNVSYIKPFKLSLLCCLQYFTSEYNSTYFEKHILKTGYVLKFKKESFWIVLFSVLIVPFMCKIDNESLASY